MIKRKKLAMLRRKREASQQIKLDREAEERIKERTIARKNLLKKMKPIIDEQAKKEYHETMALPVHEPRPTWASGPVTKKRSVLDDY